MKAQKSQAPQTAGMSINALSEKTGIDRRTLKKRLKGAPMQPDGGYAIKDVETALAAVEDNGDLKDTKLRAYRTGISSTRIRNMQHKGCPNGQSKCKLCRKKIKTDTTKKHQAFTDTAIVCD